MPPTTFKVLSETIVPPPVNPVPAITETSPNAESITLSIFAESMSNTPVLELYVKPLLPDKCARTSEALGPVYVNTPVDLSYVNEPSPPASVADNDALEILT